MTSHLSVALCVCLLLVPSPLYSRHLEGEFVYVFFWLFVYYTCGVFGLYANMPSCGCTYQGVVTPIVRVGPFATGVKILDRRKSVLTA